MQITTPGTYDFVVDHLGKDGIAIVGFFTDKEIYKQGDGYHRPSQADKDPLFQHYEKLAKDQEWLHSVGMGHKKWVFGYGHNKDVALTCGCEEVASYPFQHGCVIIAKSSKDGKRTQVWSTTHFGNDHSKSIK